ncbi:MAG: hypothetical protein IJS44_02890 [Clostridia bacterium]|nr:hypothetical protein [Clostridia bacterium]
MKEITVKKAKHLCMMPACKNTDTYKVSGSRSILGGFYLCGDCIAQMAAAIAAPGGKKRAGRTAAEKKEG